MALILGIAVLLAVLSSGQARGQGLPGASSLIVTPTAEMWADGRVAFGVDVMPDVRLFSFEQPQYVASGIAAIQILPFVQVGLRISRVFEDRSDGFQGVGDRSIIARVRVWDESEWVPAVTLGTRDPLGASVRNFGAIFAVATKTLIEMPLVRAARVHVGYGHPALDGVNYPLEGPFGGLSIEPHPWVRMIAEYDTRDVNVGLGLRLIEHLDVSVRLYGFAELGGAVSYSIGL